MDTKQIIKEIMEKQAHIKSVIFIGCGASKADLYPAKYFLENNSKKLRVSHYTANEFNYSTVASLDETAIVISASLGGSTPETVKANKKAKENGAHLISLTNSSNSQLAKNADYIICHRFSESYGAKLEKMGYALELAVEILERYEGYKYYKDMEIAFSKIYNISQKAAEAVIADAKRFAEDYKDEKVIYVMSSGPTAEVAYSTSICLMMEMQWIHSGSFHSGEFFHGPFEIVDKDVPFILLMNDGSTRPIDARALTFLKRFETKTTVVDALDHGLSSVVPKTVVDYFNPMLITAVFRVYAEELSYARKHPLTKRRYMWKLEY